MLSMTSKTETPNKGRPSSVVRLPAEQLNYDNKKHCNHDDSTDDTDDESLL